ncbi:MAG: hypothetical protein QXV74_03400 [Candidatus Bathyarchaeia archaeon]
MDSHFYAARGGFQLVKEEEAQEIIQRLSSRLPEHKVVERGVSVHERIKDELVQLGKLQGFIAESKYEMERGKNRSLKDGNKGLRAEKTRICVKK